MKTVGFVGWRGMVGSVLMERMIAEGDFRHLEPHFFSTSQIGRPAPAVGVDAPAVADAKDLSALATMDIIVTCQGGGYTTEIHDALRNAGWKGSWIDAASTKRLDDDSIIVLDPVNGRAIETAIDKGVKNFIGGNCTVSLLLMAMVGLFRKGWVEWVTSMTYQAASGAGAVAMRELVSQMKSFGDVANENLLDPATSILELDRGITERSREDSFPTAHFGAPLAGGLIPWIDRPVEGGRTREEWKGHVEANKILELNPEIPVDGICVRIGAMRCHSQAVTVKLNREVPLDEIESVIAESHSWVEVVPNTKEATLARLSPTAISGTLDVPVGRIHSLKMGPEYLSFMTVGDQLLWGAAEPLRRVLRMLVD